jgi:hypothetical protein
MGVPRVEYDSHVGAEEAARCLASLSTPGGTSWVLRVLTLGKVLRVLTLAKPACVASHPRAPKRRAQAIRARTDVQPCAFAPTLAEDHPSGSTHSTPCEYPE